MENEPSLQKSIDLRIYGNDFQDVICEEGDNLEEFICNLISRISIHRILITKKLTDLNQYWETITICSHYNVIE